MPASMGASSRSSNVQRLKVIANCLVTKRTWGWLGGCFGRLPQRSHAMAVVFPVKLTDGRLMPLEIT